MGEVEEANVPEDELGNLVSGTMESELRRPLFVILLAITLIELSPANEGIRLSIWLAAGGISHRPFLGAASYGGATLIVEFAGVLAAAPLLGTSASRRLAVSVNRKLGRVFKRDVVGQLPWSTRATAAILGGSVVAMTLKLRDATDTPSLELRRFGLVVSLWLALVCAVQGALMSEGIKLGVEYPAQATILIALAIFISMISYFIRPKRRACKVPVAEPEP